jgi:hypothetical protein
MNSRYLPACNYRVLTRQVPAITKSKLGQCFMCRINHPGEAIFKIRGLGLGLTPCLPLVSFTHVLKHKVNVIMNIKTSFFFFFLFCVVGRHVTQHIILSLVWGCFKNGLPTRSQEKKKFFGGHIFMLGKAQVVAGLIGIRLALDFTLRRPLFW